MHTRYVVTYDNGSGYREWATTPQMTEEAAWQAAGIKEGEEFFLGSAPRVEAVNVDENGREILSK